MKFIISLFTLILCFFSTTLFAFGESFWTQSSEVIYCQWDSCGLEKWIELVKVWVDDIETTATASDYLQGVVKYLLWFISLIAVLFIIYSWFRILVSSWDEEIIKTAKNRIIYVIVWILIIRFAWAITNFAIWLGAAWWWTSSWGWASVSCNTIPEPVLCAASLCSWDISSNTCN